MTSHRSYSAPPGNWCCLLCTHPSFGSSGYRTLERVQCRVAVVQVSCQVIMEEPAYIPVAAPAFDRHSEGFTSKCRGNAPACSFSWSRAKAESVAFGSAPLFSMLVTAPRHRAREKQRTTRRPRDSWRPMYNPSSGQWSGMSSRMPLGFVPGLERLLDRDYEDGVAPSLKHTHSA